MTLGLLDLPHEVLHCILTNVDPHDLAHLCCCRALHAFIKSDKLLFKILYLKNLDDPRRKGTDREFAWEEELYKFVNSAKILESKNADLKRAHFASVAQSVDSLLRTSAVGSEDSLNLGLLAKCFHNNGQNMGIFLSNSSLFRWANTDLWRRLDERQPRSLSEEDNCTSVRKSRAETNEQGSYEEFGGESGQDPAIVGSHQDRRTNHVTETVRSRQALSPPPLSDHVGIGGVHQQVEQLSAKLHCLYGVPITYFHRTLHYQRYNLRNETEPIHPFARSRVYNLLQHTDNTCWGPFLEEEYQQVDWEKLESIMIILHYNVKLFSETHELSDKRILSKWEKPFEGAYPYSYVSAPLSIPMEPSLPLEAKDPYNVTGTWMRVLCFLDYTELFNFNFPSHYSPKTAQRPLDTEEAIRLITMKIQITKIEKPGEEDGQEMPVVRFKGTSSSFRPSWDANANSKIRGMVRLTPHGEVRWTTWSIYHGEERWRSEGIQVGGVQSARGVLGYWFDKDFDKHGPAGPTAFWKSHDGIEVEEPAPDVLLHGIHALHAPLY